MTTSKPLSRISLIISSLLILHTRRVLGFSIGRESNSRWILLPTCLQLGADTTEKEERNSELTDWVIENLESDDSSITSSSTVKAGEGDTLPETGLLIGEVRIFAANADDTVVANQDEHPIRLLVGRNGWGTGVHPSTRLCLEFVCDHIQGGEVLLDYGCGSGVLSIAALRMGSAKCIGVDVEAEALVTAERNIALNGYGEERFEGLHTREVLPYEISPPAGVDVCVANILIGQLVRPSMVAALTTNLARGGLLCLSGIRPDEVDSLKAAYDESIEWIEEQYAELSADETECSVDSYGFNVGRWSRLVGRKRSSDRKSDLERMSELAVS
jgi:ribosomal protein L11 methylase PrmA